MMSNLITSRSQEVINKKGQVTVFIIIAILIVAAIGIFFTFKDQLMGTAIPASIEPVYMQFLSCVEENLLVGIDVLESQGGYIFLPEFERGSRYYPFSSQLDFAGSAVPYWYYVSENGFEKEQVPSLQEIENELEKFMVDQIHDCDFDLYYDQGFMIDKEIPKAKVNIKNNEVEVKIDMAMKIERVDESSLIKSHKVSVDSHLGKLYADAKRIYNNEQKNFFLETYGLDTLRLYAPVDGVEFTCSPEIWSAEEVFNNLQEAIESNTNALKVKGGEYVLSNKENEYFEMDLGVSSNVRFVNSRTWPYNYEVLPSDGDLLMAEPIGNQQGLGVLGFCYTPYHFVYNLKYPVMVQVYEGEEIFQFPMAIVIEGNKEREALEGESFEVETIEVCKYKNTMTGIRTIDRSGNQVLAEISYECLGEVCLIGQSPLETEFPQCVNGYVIAKAEGYVTKRYLYSALEEGSLLILLEKEYPKNIILKLDNELYGGRAIISFVSDFDSKTILYPEQKEVDLSEGTYEIQVQIYKSSSLTLEAITKEQCMEVLAPGLRGLMGIKTKECFDIDMPEQIISEVLIGGGSLEYYILEDQLKSSSTIEINADKLDIPNTLEDLQKNYEIFETKSLGVGFI